jgi:hypothetical protein
MVERGVWLRGAATGEESVACARGAVASVVENSRCVAEQARDWYIYVFCLFDDIREGMNPRVHFGQEGNVAVACFFGRERYKR